MSTPDAWHVTRTMRTLELLALRPRSAVEVANATGVHPRTARRLLARLLAEGYVSKSSPRHGKYGVTLKLVAVARHVLEHADLVREALPHVESLRDETNAHAHFSVASYRFALRLIDEQAERHGSVRPQVAEKVPCHCSASGQVLLAFRRRWCDSVLMQPLDGYTERTLVCADALRARLHEVRANGFAVEDGEHLHGVGSVASAVFDHTGEAVGALGVTVPSTRLADVGCLTAVIVRAAANLSERVGYEPGTAADDDGPTAAALAMVPAARSHAS